MPGDVGTVVVVVAYSFMRKNVKKWYVTRELGSTAGLPR